MTVEVTNGVDTIVDKLAFDFASLLYPIEHDLAVSPKMTTRYWIKWLKGG